jgi:hypothetical protein
MAVQMPPFDNINEEKNTLFFSTIIPSLYLNRVIKNKSMYFRNSLHIFEHL